MQPPTLTFACELDVPRLTPRFDDTPVLADLRALGARVVLMLSDYLPKPHSSRSFLDGWRRHGSRPPLRFHDPAWARWSRGVHPVPRDE